MHTASRMMRGEAVGIVSVAELGEALSSLRLCTPDARQQMESSLGRIGQLTPILVHRSATGLETIDGFKRLHAARALGWKELRAERVEVDSPGAKLRVWQSNAGRGLTDVEEAWLVRALYREDGLTQGRIGQLLGRHKSWVCRRLMLAEGLCDEIQANVRLGLLSATAIRELGRLPRGNQAEVAQVVMRRGLTTRQTARLVDELLAAVDDVARQQVLAEAMGWGSESGSKTTLAHRTPGEWIIADTAAVARLSARLHARLLERSLSSLGSGAADIAGRNLEALRPGLLSLCRTIERVMREYGVGHEKLEW